MQKLDQRPGQTTINLPIQALFARLESPLFDQPTQDLPTWLRSHSL